MAKYLLLALNGPTSGEGDEAAYNKWYDEVHVPGFKAIDSVRTARRYKVLNGKLPGAETLPYVTAYEIETDDLQSVMGELGQKLNDFPPELDRARSGHLLAIRIGAED